MNDNSDKTHIELKLDVVSLDGKLDRVADGIEVLKDRLEEMANHIAKIKEAVYNPEQGIYARLRELESWKESQARLMWIVTSGVVGLIAAALVNTVVS